MCGSKKILFDISLKKYYQIISELLLYPLERNEKLISDFYLKNDDRWLVVKLIKKFISNSTSNDCNEYLQTLELSPSCPLYMGYYLFDEPSTCNGISTSSRNIFMIEVKNIYRHFGFDLISGEMSDFLPIMVDFLWISLENHSRDKIGLRRRFLEYYFFTGLGMLYDNLKKYKSIYSILIEALKLTVERDIKNMLDIPAWVPPKREKVSGNSLFQSQYGKIKSIN